MSDKIVASYTVKIHLHEDDDAVPPTVSELEDAIEHTIECVTIGGSVLWEGEVTVEGERTDA